jgi:uncharacterized protein (TIGR03435 family)
MRVESLVVLVLTTAAVLAQPPATTKPSFEVVSIRPGSHRSANCPGSTFYAIGQLCGGPGSPDPERFTGNNALLRGLVQRAYGMQAFQVIGPDWISTAVYDITAKVRPGATPEDLKLMIQTLLEDRFELRIHHETHEFPGYNLVLAKGGLKLKESISTDPCAAGGYLPGKTCPQGVSYSSAIAPMTPGGRAGTAMTTPPRDGRGSVMTAWGITVANLASSLQNQLRGSVITDKTGVTDKFDVRLEFSPPDVGTAGDFSAPSIFTALEKDLGLKLEPAKTQLDCIVIDHIEAPGDN